MELFAFFSAAADLAADFANALGFNTLFGLNAFLILKTAQAVPTACPAASSPSLVALAASSPYLFVTTLSYARCSNVFANMKHSTKK